MGAKNASMKSAMTLLNLSKQWKSHLAKISALHGLKSKHLKNAKRATKNSCKNSKKLERNALLKSVTLFLTLKNSKNHLAKINAWHGPKKEASKECKKSDKDCMEKFQKIGKKCVAEKCKKPEKPEKPSCEDQCLAAAKKEATANCKKEDKACYQKYQKMADKCAAEKC